MIEPIVTTMAGLRDVFEEIFPDHKELTARLQAELDADRQKGPGRIRALVRQIGIDHGRYGEDRPSTALPPLPGSEVVGDK